MTRLPNRTQGRPVDLKKECKVETSLRETAFGAAAGAVLDASAGIPIAVWQAGDAQAGPKSHGKV